MTLVINVSCKGSAETKRFVLDENDHLDVGRGNEDLNLVVDPRLSRRHFIIRYVDNKIEIEHLSKTNPTIVASDGTGDFQKVKNVRVEEDACRIIAGSHRFVLTVEKPDSCIDKTIDVDQSDFWSDVDDVAEEEKGAGAVRNVPEPSAIVNVEPVSQANSESVAISKQRPTTSDEVESPSPLGTMNDGGFSEPSSNPSPDIFSDDIDDDLSDESEHNDVGDPFEMPTSGKSTIREIQHPTLAEPAEPSPKPGKEKESKRSTPKPFFPIADDFFDD
ncbi:MAG: FHA domain-containing protein [Mariniblastus sp.]